MNKNIFILFCLVLLAIESNAQLSYTRSLEGLTALQSEMTDYKYHSFLPSDKCSKFKKMRKAGTGLIIGGAAGLGLGLGLIVTGAIIAAGDEDVIIEEDTEGLGFIVGGAVLSTLGAACLSAGIPLKIIGNKKSKQYCDGNSGLFIKPTRNGVGFSYQF